MKISNSILSLKAVMFLTACCLLINTNAQVPGLSTYCPGNPTPGVPTFNQTCGSATHWSYIQSVVTTGGMVNFSNLNTNCGNTTTSFSDYTGTGMYVKQAAFNSVDVKVTWRGSCANPQLICSSIDRVYVDWGRDGTFDAVDYVAAASVVPTHPHVHYSPGSGTTTTIKVTVPGWAKEGLTRMRIITSANISHTWGAGSSCNGIFGEAEDYTFEVVNPCLPPNVISVANLDYKSADFAWTPKLNSEFYEYVVTTVDTIPHDTVSGFTFTKNTSVDVDTFKCDTKYYIMVRVVCDTAGKIARDWKRSGWVRDSFTTDPCCYSPVLTVDNITSTTARVQWDPIPTSFGYEYAVSTTPEPPQQGTFTVNTSVLLQGLQTKTTHFVHVRSRCTPTPLSEWSKSGFKTLKSLSVNSLTEGKLLSINLYPNPVQYVLTVELNGKPGNNARIELIDLSGKTLYNAPAVTSKTTINVNNISSGIYIIRYTDDTNNQIQKVYKY